MYRDRSIELSHLKRMIGELHPYRYRLRKPLKGWRYGGDLVDPPFEWKDEEARFSLDLVVEDPNSYIEGWFGGEALLKIDGKAHGQLNRLQRRSWIGDVADGKVHEIEVTVVPRGLFGEKEDSTFREAFLVVIDEEIDEVIRFAEVVADLAGETDDEGLARALMDLLEDFLSSLRIPRSTGEYILSASLDPTIPEIKRTWTAPEFPSEVELSLGDRRGEVIEGFEEFKKNLGDFRQRFGKIPALEIAVGHAHIDYEWLWPIEETRRKLLMTFSNAVLLAKRFTSFRFTQSSARYYEDLRKIDRELFEDIKKLIERGSWEPIGGMWVEADTNIPSLESLVRQFYYGQRFFEREFGLRSRVCWLPDSFGLTWTLPQVMKQFGIDMVITTKLSWNEANEFPYSLCIWRGVDGSEVVYYSYDNPDGGYNGRASARSVLGTWKNHKEKHLSRTVLLTFGHGDGGGGPSEEMVKKFEVFRELPGVPDIEMDKVEDFREKVMGEIEEKELSVWDGPLYLELHRGTYTSQSRMKSMHREVEELLRIAEIFNVAGGGGRQGEIDDIWKEVLSLQFHDIITGTSIREVYERAEKVLRDSKESLLEIIKSAAGKVFEVEEGSVLVFNPSSFRRRLVFKTAGEISLQGTVSQRAWNGGCVHDAERDILPLAAVSFGSKGVCNDGEENYSNLKNEWIEVEVMEDGRIKMLFKPLEKEVFRGAGNEIVLYKNIPHYWDNWDVDVRYERSAVPIVAEKVKILEKGGVRSVVEVLYGFEGSEVVQRYIFYASLPYLSIETVADWHTRRSLLKAIFPVNVLSRRARLDIDGGFYEVFTHRNTKFEEARFELPHHRWVDVSQSDFGVSILNDSRYGSSIHRSTIGLSLIKAGIYPDFFADEGKHSFRYAIFPHEGEEILKTVKFADVFSKDLLVFEGMRGGLNLLRMDREILKVLALKETDGGILLRLVEATGSSGEVDIDLSFFSPKRVFCTNALEEPEAEIGISNGVVRINVKPFKIYNLLLRI